MAIKCVAAAVAMGYLALPAPAVSQAVPRPLLQFVKQEQYQAGGKDWVRHRLEVVNKGEFQAALFAAAPGLPPCGLNRNSSRTWIDIYAQDGKRIYGFCALAKAEDLNSLWFATEAGVEPPRWVYIEINDRQTNTKVRSNLALVP